MLKAAYIPFGNTLNHSDQISAQETASLPKMLTVTLKTLESDGLVNRKMYAQIPPKVEYSLTMLGETLVPHLMKLYDWANTDMPAIKASRNRSQRRQMNAIK